MRRFRTHFTVPFFLVPVLAPGCGVPERQPAAATYGTGDLSTSDGEAGPETGMETGDETGGNEGEEVETSAGSEETESGVKFDFPDEEMVPGCKVLRFLAVIDDSGSMSDEQELIGNALPDLVISTGEAAQEYNPDLPSEIAVLTTGGVRNTCQLVCNNPDFPWGCSALTNYLDDVDLCDDINAQDEAKSCDSQLGAFITTPIVFGQANQPHTAYFADCGFDEDTPYPRFLDASIAMDELDERVNCLVRVGDNGDSDEHPLGALDRATDHSMVDKFNWEGTACNQGFFDLPADKKESFLVIIIATDEDDALTAQQLADLRLKITALQGGDERVMVVALVDNHVPNTWPKQLIANPECDPAKALEGANVIEFAQGFPLHHCGSLHESLDALFVNVLSDTISQGCYNVHPAG